ncbi:hypothetical protein PZA11_004245 [Diplocarpon coronariae]|uniref:Putative transcription factor kapC n=1 Tax=Diplocarpon coronariae TaxID=2795749 RepID=A0A218YSU3_9HELO|nr:hypothetical protein B2J93_5268 [Marssonina coronariae]
MATEQYPNGSVGNQSYMMTPEGTSALYDGTSSDSSASSPINYNGFENLYNAGGYMAYPQFPMQHTTSGGGMARISLIPVELDVEGLCEDHDRRRRQSGTEKTVSSYLHSRRRAQNRASQRAFRDRKEKHMKELQHRLGELEARHSDLSRSYESLQVEYSRVKQQLDRMLKDNDRREGLTRVCQPKEWEDSKGEIIDPLLFDASDFYFDQDDQDRKE